MAATDRGFADPNPAGRAAVPKNSWGLSLGADGELRIALAGPWVLTSGGYSAAEISRRLAAVPAAKVIDFDLRDLAAWDSVLIDFLNKLETIASGRAVAIDRSSLRAQRRRGRGGRHFCGRPVHRADHCGRRHCHRHLQHPRHLIRRRRAR
jgi:hypothetical protein